MDRELDPVYLQALRELEPVLEQLGFELAAEHHYPDAFGSANAEYRRLGARVELVWDGKDRHLWLRGARVDGRAHASPAAWRDLEAEADGRPHASIVLRLGPVADARIASLAESLRAFGTAARAV
jgi:hypothetical protein